MNFTAFDDPTGVFFGGLVLTLGTVILVVTVWKVADLLRARYVAKAAASREQEYRRLAQQATRVEQDVAERLGRLEGIESRLAEIERVLREVDEPALASR